MGVTRRARSLAELLEVAMGDAESAAAIRAAQRAQEARQPRSAGSSQLQPQPPSVARQSESFYVEGSSGDEGGESGGGGGEYCGSSSEEEEDHASSLAGGCAIATSTE
jgi:hypothetical protein